jgi:hypothetical protein
MSCVIVVNKSNIESKTLLRVTLTHDSIYITGDVDSISVGFGMFSTPSKLILACTL